LLDYIELLDNLLHACLQLIEFVINQVLSTLLSLLNQLRSVGQVKIQLVLRNHLRAAIDEALDTFHDIEVLPQVLSDFLLLH
jgi:hypothetical protein